MIESPSSSTIPVFPEPGVPTNWTSCTSCGALGTRCNSASFWSGRKFLKNQYSTVIYYRSHYGEFF